MYVHMINAKSSTHYTQTFVTSLQKTETSRGKFNFI